MMYLGAECDCIPVYGWFLRKWDAIKMWHIRLKYKHRCAEVQLLDRNVIIALVLL